MDRAAMVRPDRLASRLEELSRIGGTPGGGVSRFPYSKEHAEAVRLVAGWMEEAGLKPCCDALGNLIGTSGGSRSQEGWPSIVLGSHLDTVPEGGMFDGALGVVAAVEVAAAIREGGLRLGHPLSIVGFAAEEAYAYGVGALASRCLVGGLSRSRCSDLVGYDGRTLGTAIASFTTGLLSGCLPRAIGVYLELHAEQGPVLWKAGWRVAAVSVITGIVRTTVTITGEANHAGTTPMSQRRDALVGAAEFVLAARSLATQLGPPAVGTVGALLVRPGASNVVPGDVEMMVEFRSHDAAHLRSIRDRAEECLGTIGQRENLVCRVDSWDLRDPVPLDQNIQEVVSIAIRGAGHEPRVVPSGAGHDAMVMAQCAPAGMVFVPSIGGVSHSPRERTDWDDVALGAEVLLRTVMLLDGQGRLPVRTLPEPPERLEIGTYSDREVRR